MKTSKLRDSEVEALRHLAVTGGFTAPALASAYRIDVQRLYLLLRGDSYKNAPGPITAPVRRLSPSATHREWSEAAQSKIMQNIVAADNGCWHYVGSQPGAKGYCNIKIGGRSIGAHRLSYLVFVGDVPEGHDVSHLCHDADQQCYAADRCEHRRCVRPDHLAALPHAENVAGGRSGWRQAAVTHCPAGHPYDSDNTYRLARRTNRVCRTCRRAQNRALRIARTPGGVTPTAIIREWALTTGLEVAPRGPLPAWVQLAFEQAHPSSAAESP